MQYAFHDFIGNIGLVLLLGTYLLLQMDKIDSGRLSYSLLNALASLCIGISLLFAFNMSAFLVEAFWLIISLYGIIKCLLRRHARVQNALGAARHGGTVCRSPAGGKNPPGRRPYRPEAPASRNGGVRPGDDTARPPAIPVALSFGTIPLLSRHAVSALSQGLAACRRPAPLSRSGRREGPEGMSMVGSRHCRTGDS